MASARTSAGDLAGAFRDPPADCRPLQIVHELASLPAVTGAQTRREEGTGAGDLGVAGELQRSREAARTDREDLERALAALRDMGLGGVVTNVSFRNYLEDEEAWNLFLEGVKTASRLGLRVWIYDEQGYPSGAAGRHVLAGHPELEARELVHDPSATQPFHVRPSFEGTHAANNYYALRRYPNLLDARVGRRFAEVTHEAYAKRLGAELLAEVEAFFTDEPSLMACSLGQIPEQARAKVPVVDQPDPQVRLLPAVPWAEDLPERWRERYGTDLLERRADLFGGDDAAADETRRRFWALVAELLAERYFGALRHWCGAHGVASSGHCLAEEDIVRHPALSGNLLRLLGEMDIPGIDVLSTDPAAPLRSGGYLLAAGYAASAALLAGRRRVMTEVSDHSERMAGRSIGLEQMLATAAWQYALGVTEFTLYYSPQLHGRFFRAYCDGVGRLGALLRDAERVVPAALYYPIREAWTHYRPTAAPLAAATQPVRLQAVAKSLAGAARTLWAAGVPFCLVDHDHLAAAEVKGGLLRVGAGTFGALVLPDADELPAEARASVDRFRELGGIVLHLNSPDAPDGRDLGKLSPFPVDWDGPGCLVAAFRRPGLDMVLLVNTAGEARRGICRRPVPEGAVRWGIGSGVASPLPAAAGPWELALAPLEVAVLSWPGG